MPRPCEHPQPLAIIYRINSPPHPSAALWLYRYSWPESAIRLSCRRTYPLVVNITASTCKSANNIVERDDSFDTFSSCVSVAPLPAFKNYSSLLPALTSFLALLLNISLSIYLLFLFTKRSSTVFADDCLEQFSRTVPCLTGNPCRRPSSHT